ncbi:MAG TPA: amylo-alpha-1,6-glucosidase [Thermoanaerobaculia bacterium]|nr:amylo-alpha-1,6-glucosidase [Thermoanaerobaculia bacterium]
MEEIVQLQEQHYILATAPRAGERTRVLKDGESFAVFDRCGAIRPVGLGEMGLFHEGTRYLSVFELFLESCRPLLLSSTVRADNALIVDLTNPDIEGKEGVALPRDTLHIFATAFLWQASCYMRFRLHNYSLSPLDLRLSLRFAADYADIFEIRGTRRERKGHKLSPVVGRETVVLGYEGLDARTRRTRITFSPTPHEITDSAASFSMSLPPRGETLLSVTISFENAGEAPRVLGFDKALERATAEVAARRSSGACVETSNESFNLWAGRSANDLQMMITETPYGLYPYAGVPWFSSVFGRDGILTAYETLWLDPALARGVLSLLAATQARELNAAQDAEPGKIVHEMRKGEMAVLGEVPFARYYGSVDATPLFVVLAGAYYRRTGDRTLIESLWPALENALSWIDQQGDLDGDGFVEYSRRSANGLTSQGWKDSLDAVFHRDGTLAEGPIALCEVQAYVYAARRQAAALARVLGDEDRAARLERQAGELRDKFERSFWSEQISTYALALDGRKSRCDVRTSNAGHCLFAEIASPPRARRVAHTLLNESSFSGWGIRTLDANEARYNPMSYHNGSVWPHDNALVASGMARYGIKDGALKILTALFDASQEMDLYRMPELFCGFRRRAGEGPTLYPVACAPQAWAAGSVFLLLQSCLGLDIDAPAGRICLQHPVLPEGLNTVSIRNLTVGKASVDLVLRRHGDDVGVHLERREGEVEVVVVK